MSIRIDADDRLIHDSAASFALDCPHCGVHAHMSPMSSPTFRELVAHKPAFVGLVYRCDSCNAPVFLKVPVRMYADARVELGPGFVELERSREKFSFTYIPEDVEALFKEALSCYAHGEFNAFGSMCRRTAQALFQDLGDAGRLKLYEQLVEVRGLVSLEPDTFAAIKQVVFGNDTDPYPGIPEIDPELAGVLLEVIKDLLYQSYIRKGKLQRAMMMRRFFAEESTAAA
ncbi:MAG TPA: hypothetical protein VLT59_14140, partial [Steroidobacteraceae bacterium]|nr:hypothetical protein [Steroidobacteraceae bacterium]